MIDTRIRRARQEDAAAIAGVWLASYRATYEFGPVHTDAEVAAYMRDVIIPARETWVAVTPDAEIVGMMALTADEVDQLYLAPGWTGRGIGSRLIELAKRRRPGGLTLSTFQVNSGARRFYERHGFVEIGRGDGSGNEEAQADAQYAWPPRTSQEHASSPADDRAVT